MGEQTGVIRLKGKVGELTFRLAADGKTIVGTNSRLNKERINTEPAFQRTRENNSEFSGSAKAASGLKIAYASLYKRFADSTAFNRWLKLMREIISKDTGVRGERPVDVVAHKLLLQGVNFHATDKLSDVFLAPYSAVINPDRNEIVYTIPDFNTTDYLTIPEGATHIKLFGACGAMSNYIYSTNISNYEPAVPEQNSIGTFVTSTEIPIGGMVGADTILTATLPGSPVLDAQVLFTGALGIEFLLESGGVFYTLASNNALQITHTA